MKPRTLTRPHTCILIHTVALLGLMAHTPVLLAQSPGGVSTNLSLWVKADAALPTAGGTLTSWPDQTRTNTFTKSGSGMTTAANMINFHPVVEFNGSGKLVGNKSITWAEATTVASWTGATTIERGTVVSPTTSGTAPDDASRYYFRAGVESTPGDFLYSGMGVDSIGFVYTTSPPSGQVSEYTSSGVGNVFDRNGLNAAIDTLFGGFTKRATVMTGIPQIGDRSTDDAPMIGNIAEIIVYSANNATGRNKVESYLALKYGLTLGNIASPVNYTSSADAIFWNGNVLYQHNIFGIGADQGSALTQTTSNSMNSGSGTGAGLSGLGNLVLTAASLSNQQFLMIGTDSASLGQEMVTAANGPAVAIGSERVIRTWQVQNTGTVGAVALSFDLTGLALAGGTTATNYWLMIDNDGDGDFTTGTQSFVDASSLAGTKVNFNAVTLSNNIVFTIITKPSSGIVLSTTLENFTAIAQQNTALLQWTVNNQPDIDDYEIQRSADGINFARTGNVAATSDIGSAAGNLSYAYRETLSPGVYYYRINMVNKDGSAQLSTVRSVKIEGQTGMRIIYNPVRGNQLELLVNLSAAATTQIGITDSQGRLLLHSTASVRSGSSQLTIVLPQLAKGLYYVSLQTGGFGDTLAFLK